MKTFKKWGLIIVITLAVVITAAVSYITLALPDVGQPETIKINYTPQRIAHGKYLANYVAACTDCHSGHDEARFTEPVDTARLGVGGRYFSNDIGFPGQVYTPNITPFHLTNWTDGEIFRAITAGVKKDGSAIFPLMPWPSYAKMDKEDVYDIIAYLRTLKPLKASYPERKLNFPLNIIVHTMPQKAPLGKRPAESDTLKYGAYLVQTAACNDCHTAQDKGTPLPGMDFAGGRPFIINGGTVRSANITADKNTGIGNWTKAQFIARFAMYADTGNALPMVKKGDFQTVMPWGMYSKLKKTDLEAMYAYIKTIKPVSNKVTRFSRQ